MNFFKSHLQSICFSKLKKKVNARKKHILTNFQAFGGLYVSRESVIALFLSFIFVKREGRQTFQELYKLCLSSTFMETVEYSKELFKRKR